MEPSLAAFLLGRTPAATERVVWPQSGGEFDFHAYLTPDPPPLELVVSARAILLRDGLVLAFESGSGTTHVIPGGRRERGESLADTLTREIREEVGCEIAPGAASARAHPAAQSAAAPRWVPLPLPRLPLGRVRRDGTAGGRAFG